MLERIIKKAKSEKRRVNIYAHQNPDGDAIASAKTLEAVLQDNGIRAAYIITSPRVNNRYRSIVGDIERFLGRVSRESISIILDTSTRAYVENDLYRFSKPENTYVIDHHEKDPKNAIEDALGLPKENVIRIPESSSTCEILAEKLEELGMLNKKYGTSLLVGVWTDTAKFKFLGPKTSTNLQLLLDRGADMQSVKKCIEAKRNLKQEVGLAKALLTLQRIKVGNTYLNFLGIDNKTLLDLETKYGTRDIQKKIFKLTDIENSALSVAIAESEKDNYLCEFRSNKDLGNVDVFTFASNIGGEGHFNASGATVKSQDGFLKTSRSVLEKLTSYALPNLVGLPEYNKNDAKISFERFMTRNLLLTQIPEEQLEDKVINIKLDKSFIEKVKSEYGLSEQEVLKEIEIFKDLDIEKVTIEAPSGNSISIDSEGTIKEFKEESVK